MNSEFLQAGEALTSHTAIWTMEAIPNSSRAKKTSGCSTILIDADCAGGFMFAWMDEWFKPTWIVSYLESFGFFSGYAIIPTRQLWHNLTSPEQNFGLISFDQAEMSTA